MDLPMPDTGENVLVVTDDFQYYIPNLTPAIRQVQQQQQQQQPVSHHNPMAMGGHIPIPQSTQALMPQANMHPHGMRSSHTLPTGMDMGDGLQMLGNICMQTQQESMGVGRTLSMGVPRTVMQTLPVQNCNYAQMTMNGTAMETQQVNTMVTQSKEHGYSRSNMVPQRDNLNYQSSEAYKAALMIMNPDPINDNISAYQTVQLSNVNLNNVSNTNILPNMNMNTSTNLCTLNSVNTMSSLTHPGEITIDNCQLLELRGQFSVGTEMEAFQKEFEEDKSAKKNKSLMKKDEEVTMEQHVALEQISTPIAKPRKKGSGRKAKVKLCHFCDKELVEPDKSVLFKIGADGKSVFFDTCNMCLAVENDKIAAGKKEILFESFQPVRITVQEVQPVLQFKKDENLCEICQKQVEKIISVIAQIENGKVTYKNACKECSFKPKKTEDLKEKKRKLKLKKKKLRLKKLKEAGDSADGQGTSTSSSVVMPTVEEVPRVDEEETKVLKTTGTQVEEDPYKWKCSSCMKNFASKSELQKHRRKNHRYYRLFQCDQCENRIKIYSSTEIVDCLTCGKKFDQTNYSPYTLSKQFYVKRAILDLKCPICKKEFSSRRGVLEHEKIHTNYKPHLCNTCGKTFRTLPPLRIHMRVHTGEKPYKCEMCGKCFRQSSALNMHIRHHTGETPYACLICTKKFARRSQYTKHMESHTEKTFECTECKKKFPTQVRLRRHHRKHTDENPYRCHICGMNYEENSAYRRHMQKHDVMNPYRCGLCGKQFGGRRGLLDHSTVHQAGNEFKCGICGEEYLNKTDLDTHIQTHFIEKPYKCVYCDLGFSTNSLLEHHVNFHSSREFFDCKKCHKKFTKRVTLDMHMRRHDGAKPFKCYICGEQYLWSTTLDSHMKTHYITV